MVVLIFLNILRFVTYGDLVCTNGSFCGSASPLRYGYEF